LLYVNDRRYIQKTMLIILYEVCLYSQVKSIDSNSTVEDVTDILETIVNVTTDGNDGSPSTTLTSREVLILTDTIEYIANVLNTTTNITEEIVEVS